MAIGSLSALGTTSPISWNSYIPHDDNGAMVRYVETQLLISDTYKEQQYWLSVYNRAQQFGLRGTTVQEILTQLTRVSQKLQQLQNIMLPAAQNALTNENKNNEQIANLFQSES